MRTPQWGDAPQSDNFRFFIPPTGTCDTTVTDESVAIPCWWYHAISDYIYIYLCVARAVALDNKLDIFGFGGNALFLLAGIHPVIVEPNQKPSIPDTIGILNLRQLISHCWEAEPKQRLTTSELLTQLDEICHQLNNPTILAHSELHRHGRKVGICHLDWYQNSKTSLLTRIWSKEKVLNKFCQCDLVWV